MYSVVKNDVVVKTFKNMKQAQEEAQKLIDAGEKGIAVHLEPNKGFSTIMRESFLSTVRDLRNKILAATDFLVSVSDANITQQEKDSVLEYREALRNITDISILTADNFEEYFVENKSVPSLSDIFPAPPECIRDIVGQVFTR